VMRFAAKSPHRHRRVKQKGLPPRADLERLSRRGVELVAGYDRSGTRKIDNTRKRDLVLEEAIIVSLVDHPVFFFTCARRLSRFYAADRSHRDLIPMYHLQIRSKHHGRWALALRKASWSKPRSLCRERHRHLRRRSTGSLKGEIGACIRTPANLLIGRKQVGRPIFFSNDYYYRSFLPVSARVGRGRCYGRLA